MCTHTMFLLPWGSLVAMEFSDPETKRSPNQLADIHMHTSEWLITEANSTSQREFPSLKLTQTVKSSKSSVNSVFHTALHQVRVALATEAFQGFDYIPRFVRCKCNSAVLIWVPFKKILSFEM